jgi:hypothetical protein
MRLLRLLLALPVVAGVAAWLVADGGAAPETPLAPPSVRADLDAARAEEVAAHASRLRERLASMPARPGAARNPFRFDSAARPSARLGRTIVRDTAPQLAEAPPAAPVRPDLHLIGMAEDTTDGGVQRTAIVSGLNQVYLVREGDQIAMRFLVKRVGVDAVEIEDLSDSTPISLGLR